MSVFVPTGATVAVDPLDVLLVARNGSTSTTLYLAQGQPVVVAALPAAVVAELNGEAGLSDPDTLFTTPVTAAEWPSPIYIAGAQVKRVQPSGATNLGSMVLFALSGFMVTVPDVDLTAIVDLINATSTGGGGTAPFTYSYSAEWTPELIFSGAAEGAFINAVYIEPGALGVSRVGSGAGVPSAGDAVRVQGALSVSGLVNGDTCNVTMPFEIGLPVCPILRADVLNVTDITVTATILDTNTIRLTFGVTSDTEGRVFVDFAYQTANAVDPS